MVLDSYNLDYYKLKEQPFGVTPDPRFLYLSASHREALATLSYGIQSRRGFISLIAKPGMGKTTILFQLLSQLEGSARTVFLFQTLCSPKELLRGILRDLGVADDGGDALRMQEQLSEVLLEEVRRGRRVVVVIDEAQNLDDSALELVRMLSNFETSSDKLMQIILAGQPQLHEKLASSHLVQLRQRMSIFARLHPFSVEETQLYVRHRLGVAGYDFKIPLFTPQAEALIAKYSEGIPRIINNICFNALSVGCVLKQRTIREEAVRECLNDLDLNDLDLEAGSANERDEKPAQRKLVAVERSKRTTVSRRSLGWRTVSAACLMFLVQLLCFTAGGQSPESLPSHALPTGSASLQTSSIELTSALKMSLPNSTVPAGASETDLRRETLTAASADVSDIPEAVSSTPVEKLTPYPRRDVQRTSDPAKLWEQVRMQSSDAEVELARLYIEGTAVPKNCAQARLLLLAASRSGNERAADLQTDYDGQCQASRLPLDFDFRFSGENTHE